MPSSPALRREQDRERWRKRRDRKPRPKNGPGRHGSQLFPPPTTHRIGRRSFVTHNDAEDGRPYIDPHGVDAALRGALVVRRDGHNKFVSAPLMGIDEELPAQSDRLGVLLQKAFKILFDVSIYRFMLDQCVATVVFGAVKKKGRAAS
jgi:hypothetical protein